MLHLVTGATGNIGARVVRGLVSLGARPRVLTRDLDKARLLFGDDVDHVVGDLSNQRSLEAAFDGVDVAFLVNSGPDLARRDRSAAQVAKKARVGRLVKLSSLGARAAGRPATAVALWHANGEAAIRESAVPYTLIQSVGFMSNALAWAATIKAMGVVRASAGDGRIAMIHPDDLASVAIGAMTRPTHEGETLAVTGPEALSYAEMTALMGGAVGRPISYIAVSDDEARRIMTDTAMPPALVDALVTLWREVREGLVSIVTGEVERVTGRKPTTFARWVEQNSAAFR